MSRSPSLAGRAAAAVALMVGFYLLAVAIALLLLWIPYAEVVYANRLHFKLAAVCVIGAVIILWSVIPRPDRFTAPGPRLERDQHPRLFERIDDIAVKTEQQSPAEVYLVHDVNAWVSSRGGIMGWGSRRIMGIGLPLLQALSVSEFTAVLAHEFGHYHGGDVAMGPWVHQTRAAIGRTLHGLEQHSGFLQKPFEWYGALFLRVSHAISRAQEYAADALAARVAGVAAMKGGLRRVTESSAAYHSYWNSEFEPVLVAGYRPPLVAGFRQFLASPNISQATAELVRKEEAEGEADPYDTHPSLRERLAALDELHAGPSSTDDRRALELLENPPDLERRLLQHMVVESHYEKLKDVGWDEVGARVLLPQWQAGLAENRAALADVTVAALADRMKDMEAFTRTFPGRPEHASDEIQQSYVRWVVGGALTDVLVRAGGTVHTLPGEPVKVRTDAGDVEPFGWATELGTDGVSTEEWRQRCERHGIADLSLTEAAPIPA